MILELAIKAAEVDFPNLSFGKQSAQAIMLWLANQACVHNDPGDSALTEKPQQTWSCRRRVFCE
jgi:hypothetical protein